MGLGVAGKLVSFIDWISSKTGRIVGRPGASLLFLCHE